VVDPGKVQQTVRLVIDAKGVVLHFSSLDQGEASFPSSEFSIEGERVSAKFARINLKIDGVLKDDRHMDGVMTQAYPIDLRFTRGDVADGVTEIKQPPLTADLLEAKRVAAGAPGIGAAWARAGKSTIMVAGSRSSEVRVPVRAQDQWHWGSITKSMTATLCARLVEAGVLSWETTIGQVLDLEGMQTAYRDATIVHLLSHRAGLQRDISEAEATTFSLRLADARAERLRYVKLALGQKPVAALGAKEAYSNNGYVVVGAMLEKLTGKAWETLIQGEVFAPLGIKHAGQGAPGVRGKIVQPIGHAVTKGVRVPHPLGGLDDDNIAAMGPCGRVHMPMADMLVYLAAHRDRPAKFLKAASWDTLHKPHFGGNYALGWFTSEDGRLFHAGSNTLWNGQVLVDPKGGFVCAACANDAAPETERAVEEVLLSARAAALA
jgi:CubicO group peptidase (beta-lactamase class C family)